MPLSHDPNLTPHGREKPNPSAGLGFVLAVFALMAPFMQIPFMWFGCFPGFLLAMNGFFQTRSGKEPGKGLAIAGMILNSLAISLPWLLTTFLEKA